MSTTTTTTRYFRANDGVQLQFLDTAPDSHDPILVLIHGFTGSGQVWERNLAWLAGRWRVVVPDLRGHGGSAGGERHGFHVSRLAMDLHELLLQLGGGPVRVIGGSLGCAILWSYAELFTTAALSHVVFVDQSPLQNRVGDWDERFCNRGMNCERAVEGLREGLERNPVEVYEGTVAACLSYRSHPLPDEPPNPQREKDDTAFFVGEAQRGNPTWYGKLMADHTALDWRDSIAATFGPSSGSKTKVLVVASSRSGCFPAAGPLKVVELVNGGVEKDGNAKGQVVEWGGHWCYWEDPEKFHGIVGPFLE